MAAPIGRVGGRVVLNPPAEKNRGAGRAPPGLVAKGVVGAAAKVTLGRRSFELSEVYTPTTLAKTTRSSAACAPAPVALPVLASNGAAFVSGAGSVVVDILRSDSGYENQIYWSSDNWQTKHLIGVDDHTATVDLGTFAPGTKIEFGIANGNDELFKTGPAAANVDNVAHAKIERAAGGVTIGFEDLSGGGDRDFNDAIIRVRSVPSAAGSAEAPVAVAPKLGPVPQAPLRAPEGDTPTRGSVPARAEAPVVVAPKLGVVTLAPAKARTVAALKLGAAAPALARTPVLAASPSKADNRSGLGDGTNPGQGAGRAASPNMGTTNPAGTKGL